MALARRVIPGATSGLTLGALALGACQLQGLAESETASGGNAGSDAGRGGAMLGGGGGAQVGVGVAGSQGPSVPIGGGPVVTPPEGFGGAPATTPPAEGQMALFQDQVVWNVAPAHRVLYSWTTQEQLEELRRDRVLFTRTERPGLGPGYAFHAIDELAQQSAGATHELLTMLGSLFAKARFAWPHPWATRMGWPGEDYGSELVRIVLKAEAWIVVVEEGGSTTVIDMENRPVSVEDALQHPERIGAIFFFRITFSGQGSFSTCSGGYREFIVGNENMIEEWSIETPEIRARLEADVQRFEAFFAIVRGAPPSADPETFNGRVTCNWFVPGKGEIEIYERSLAIPSENYIPRPAAIAAIIETLRASLFEPNPLIVRSGG